MRRLVLTMSLAAGLAAATSQPARADDSAEVKRLVQEEMKAWQEARKAEDAKDQVFRARFKDGLYFETADKQYSLRIGGRIHLDTQFVDADKALQGPAPGLADDYDNMTFFRRVRILFAGDLTSHVDYMIQLDFADPSDGQFRDAYITLKNLKDCWGCWVPSFRAGQHYEPIGMETVTSDNHLSFIERSGMVNLHPERSIGVSAFDAFWKDHATAQIGVFSTDGDDDENGFALWDEDDTDGGWAVTGRATLVPWAKDTCHFLHLGASASYRRPREVRFQARPGIARGPRIVDTGVINPTKVVLANAELAFVWHEFHVASEFTLENVSNVAAGDPSFTAFYVEGGWFLTGESRPYDFKRGLWGNLKPCCNFLSNNCCCWGAFQLVGRFDMLDLTDANVRGGELSTVTVGLNWYLNPYTRFMFDFVTSTAKNRTGPSGVVITSTDVNAFLIRFDVHF